MQYKIPLQIENEDVIVAGLSLRQLGIIAFGGGIGYTVFNLLEPSIGPKIATVFAAIPVVFFVVIALVRVAEMTFLPAVLNFIRLKLNSSERIWSIGTDSFSDLEIGYVIPSVEKEIAQNATLESKMNNEAEMKIGKL